LLGPPLAPLPQLQLCPVLRAPELDAGLPGGVSAERGRGAESPPSLCAHAAGDAAQGTVGFLGCECTYYDKIISYMMTSVLVDRSYLF